MARAGIAALAAALIGVALWLARDGGARATARAAAETGGSDDTATRSVAPELVDLERLLHRGGGARRAEAPAVEDERTSAPDMRPETGAVEVRLVGTDGAPVDANGSAALFERSPDGELVSSTTNWSAAFAAGVARIDGVHVGARGDLHVLFSGGYPPAFRPVEGPAHPGELVSVEIPIDTTLPRIELRLVTDGGAVLAGARTHLRFDGSDRGPWPLADERGVLAYVLASEQLPRSLAVSCTRDLRAYRGEFVLPSLAQGRNDLGTLTLVELPPFADGRVVDPDGRPVGRATIQAFAPSKGSTSWKPLRDQRTLSRDDGRFALLRVERGTSFALVASAPGFAPSRPRAFEPGDVELELRLETCGAIAGRARVADGIDPRAIEVVAEPAVEAPSGPSIARLREDGELRIEDLAPGAYTLRFRPTGSRADSLEVAGVAVREGEVSRDPRIDPLDLRDVFAVRRLEVTTAAGEPVPGLRCWTRNASGDRWVSANVEPRATRVVTLAAAGPFDAILVAPRMELRVLRGISGPESITLRPGAPLELVLSTPLPKLPDGVELRVTILHEGLVLLPTFDNVDQIERFDPSGIVRTTTTADDRVTIDVALHHPDVDLRQEVSPSRFAVPADGARVELELKIDPAHLEFMAEL